MTDRKRPSPFVTTARPLEELVPLPRTPLHQRVLQVPRAGAEGAFEWVLVLWEDPGGARALHQALQRLVEATLLAELSRPASDHQAMERTPTALRLVQLANVDGPVDAAVRPFGFQRDEPDPAWLDERMGALRTEAQATGRDPSALEPGAVRAVWTARVEEPAGLLGDQLRAMHTLMTDRYGGVWGEQPGWPSRLLAELLQRFFSEKIEPTVDGLQTAELVLVQRQTGVIRWLRPLLWQALCDLVGVVTASAFGEPVQWAVCTPEPGGFVPPPLFRIEGPSEATHVPIGLHVLRWCVMPLQPGEDVPPLAQWIESQYRQ